MWTACMPRAVVNISLKKGDSSFILRVRSLWSSKCSSRQVRCSARKVIVRGIFFLTASALCGFIMGPEKRVNLERPYSKASHMVRKAW